MKTLILLGHPDHESFNSALADAYQQGAIEAGGEVRRLNIGDLDFNPNLAFGYRKRTELEPDLLAAWEDLKWAEQLIIFHPLWWGSVPAVFKGFLDRLLLPGMAFQKKEGSLWWDKLLQKPKARIIVTMDQPTWFYRLVNGRPSYHALKKLTLQFVGIKSVKYTPIGPIRNSTPSFRTKWLTKMGKMGRKDQS